MPAIDLVADGKKFAKIGFFVQLILAAILTGATAVFSTLENSISVALGSASSIIPNGIFAFFAFRYTGAQKSRAVAKSMMQGARFKLLIVAVIFGIAFIVFKAQPVFLFCAFAISTLSYWLTMFQLSRSA
jgi:ATP synthase protein I